MSGSGSNPMGTPRWKFILRASGFCALIAITVSSLIAVVVYVRPYRLGDALVSFGDIWLVAAIPARFFGFVAGALGGGWFSIRRGRIRSTTLLVAEAVAVAIVLSMLVPPKCQSDC